VRRLGLSIAAAALAMLGLSAASSEAHAGESALVTVDWVMGHLDVG
jgi:hypothetical protein